MANRRRVRRHRAQAAGRAPYMRGGPRQSRYARPKPRKGLGPNARAAKASASRGLGHVVAASDTLSSLHGGIAAVGAGYGAYRAGKAYVKRRREKKKGPRRDSKGRFT